VSTRLLTCSVATIAVLAVAFGPRASAQPVEGLYVGAGLGGNFMQRSSIGVNLGGAGVGVNGVGETNMYFSAGFAGVASVGWGFGNGLRTEAEFGYRNNSVSSVSGIYASSNIHAGGTEAKYGLMVNVLYDFGGYTPWVTPYLGVGAGYQWVDLNGVDVSTNAGNRLNIDGTEGAFAYQAIVGVAYPLQQVPGLALTAEYRFMGLTGNRNYSATATGPNRSVSTSVRAGDEFNHSLLVGIRYALYTPAPPPPPSPAPVAAPAPAPARSYLVFFDWDKATLTDRARQVIRDAAENSTHVQYTRIEVSGYTDTSGTKAYNQALSVRRANVVAAELVKDGVPQKAITARGFGDTHLLVATGAGVREPQNRRVEIVLQ
jgi:OmpA-OmpF porin, OOP family